MQITKGTQVKVDATFRKRKSLAIFSTPPQWVLYNSNDDELLTGSAVNEGDKWVATFTIPERYVVPNGKESLTVQFTGVDNERSSFTLDKDVTVVDFSETYKPSGIIYEAFTKRPIKDVVQFDGETASISISVYDPSGVQVGTTTELADVAFSTANSSGNIYNVSIPALSDDIQFKNRFLDPYNVVYQISDTDGSDMRTETHPLYILDFRTMGILNQLTLFLDKAKLVEIDPSLQFQTSELIQAIMDGVKQVNASPPEGTFWKMFDYPATIDYFLNIAAAISALRARLMAEGLNVFDFQGLNTNLNYNRTDILTQMLSDLVSQLDRLVEAKRSAIQVAGKGIPGPGETDIRKTNIGILGLGINNMNNRIGYGRSRRFI